MKTSQLMKFARHAKIETTMKYVHTGADELRQRTDELETPGSRVSKVEPKRIRNPAKKCDQKRDQSPVFQGHQPSSCGTPIVLSENDTTLCKNRGLSSIGIGCHQRERRGSNPQPPDRQSGTLTN